MKSMFKLIYRQVLICCLFLITLGCAAKSPQPEEYSIQDKSAQLFQEQHKAILVPTAESAIGTPYRFGGTDGNGFDCSGFVRWVYSYAGVKLPRTAREQSRLGETIKNKDDMQVGDIVAFYNKRRGYHTGIYVGEGKFIHSPRRRTKVRISDLSTSYFSSSFLGARRVVDKIKDSEIEAAKELLAEFKQQEKLQATTKTKIKAKSKKAKIKAKKSKTKLVAKTQVKPKSKAGTKVKSKSKSKSTAKAKATTKAKSQVKSNSTSNLVSSTQ